MPKQPFPQPTLLEITQKYLELAQSPARQQDYERLEQLFQKTLTRTRHGEEIRAALRIDKRRQLPVQIKSPAYERILSIEGRTPKLLREYAQEMYEYGPQFTQYADTLWDEADELEGID